MNNLSTKFHKNLVRRCNENQTRPKDLHFSATSRLMACISTQRVLKRHTFANSVYLFTQPYESNLWLWSKCNPNFIIPSLKKPIILSRSNDISRHRKNRRHMNVGLAVTLTQILFCPVPLLRLNAIAIRCCLSSVCDASVLWQNAEARIVQFSLKCRPMISPWSRGSNWGGVVFDRVRDARELRWQLITNMNSYVGFRLQQKSMTLNVNLQLRRPCYEYCDQPAEAKIMQFSLKCSPMPYLFAYQDDCEIWRGCPWSGAQTVVGWFINSRCYISKMMRDRA